LGRAFNKSNKKRTNLLRIVETKRNETKQNKEMDWVCSTLVCEPKQYSSATTTGDEEEEDNILNSANSLVDGCPSSCSEAPCGGIVSDQLYSNLDASSTSASRRRDNLVSGHTSPSSLVLQRKLPDARHLILAQQQQQQQHQHQHQQQQQQQRRLTLNSSDSTGDCSNSVPSISAITDSSSSSSNSYNNSVRNRNNNININNMAISSNKSSSHSQMGDSNGGVSISNQSEENNNESKNRQSNVNVSQQFCLNPPPLRMNAWSEPPAKTYDVRSKRYATNKLKQPSEESVFKLIAIDLINAETPIYSGMCAHPNERIQKALQRERKTGVRELPEFVFAVNLCVPATTIYHAVFYLGADKDCMDEIKQGLTPFGRLMKQFIYGNSDEYRNKTFKLIPRIVEGTYVVRKAVGSKPAILGKKIKQYYVRDNNTMGTGGGVMNPRYFEVIVDIASDPVAKRITKLCLGYIKTIVVDMMFALEGHDESTLPERIFGGARIKNLDFKMLDGKRTVVPP
jgi:hypothetical protein